MRTTIVIDDELMRDALRVTGLKTKREIVDLALKTLFKLKSQQKIKQLRGQFAWEGDLEAMRTD